MALSYVFTRLMTPRNFYRDQTLRTAKTIFVRSSGLLSNQDSQSSLIAKRTTTNTLLKKIQFSPLSSLIQSRFAGHMGSEPEYKKHSHVTMWRLERILSAALLPTIPLALIMPSQALDTAVSLMIVMHTHWGLEAVIVDYIRPILFGDMVPKISIGLLYIFSAAMLAGLLNLIYNDMGLANSILHLWKS